ncbi:MAG TPA: hypothetical protein VM425_09785 [Myxococcota bacterium]|nr:hypothetical protein [Myxococcota bacterium]
MVACLAVVGLAEAARGQVREVKSFSRDMQLMVKDGKPGLSVAFDEIFTPRLRHRLSSGFTSRILIDIILSMSKRRTPVAHGLVQYTIIYDIWEETFSVREETPGGNRSFGIGSMKDLIRTCGSLHELALRPLLELPKDERFLVEVRITVNPASREMRRKVREYLANPDGSGHIGSPRSFFGSFSRIFVSEKDIQADMVYTYRSPGIRLGGN